MKRSCIALSMLLSALAGGLAIAGPRSSEAASLGQLAFTVAVENSDVADVPVCCPLACCPFADNSACTATDAEAEAVSDALDHLDALVVEDDEVELNAAETVDSDDSELAADDYSDEYDDDYDYGYEDYSDEYAQEYGPVWSDEADEVAAEEVELNAPAATAEEGPNWDEYYAEYADDYCEDENDYDSDEYDPYTCETCEDVEAAVAEETVNAATDSPCYDDLIIREEDDSQAEASPVVEDEEVYCPYDCYGHQVGDDYSYDDDYSYENEDYSYEDEDYSYDEEEYGDEYSESYDEYDYDYGYDYDYDYQHEEQVDEAADAPAVEVTESDIETQAEVDYESYYEDYYSDEYDSQSSDGSDGEYDYDYDYEQYYSQEYYDSLEDQAAEEEAAPEEESDAAEPMEDYSSDYDDVYDEAVYGDDSASLDCDRAATCPAGEVVEDDLPWADEVECGAEAAMTADAAATDCGYGCGYAEAYRRPVDEQSDEQVAPCEDAEAAMEASATVESMDLPQVKFDAASIQSLPQVFNVSRLASVCGETMAAWSKSLADLVPALEVARAQDDETAPRR